MKKTIGCIVALLCAVAAMGAAVIGYQDWQLRSSAPGNPASGFFRVWADNTGQYFKCLTGAGAACYFDPKATTSTPGIVQPDGTTITISGGVISSTGGGGGSGLFSGVLSALPTLSATGLTTAYNQSGTFSAGNNALGISATDFTSSNAWEGIVEAYPGSAFTLTALLIIPPFEPSNVGIGLVVIDSLSAKCMPFSLTGSTSINVYAFSTPSTFSSTLATASMNSPQYLWMRIKDDGTNISFYFSSDSIVWGSLYTVAKSSSYLGTGHFNYIGLTFNPNGTNGTGVTLASWTITNP